jgi:hypothetical protein
MPLCHFRSGPSATDEKPTRQLGRHYLRSEEDELIQEVEASASRLPSNCDCKILLDRRRDSPLRIRDITVPQPQLIGNRQVGHPLEKG